MVMFWAMWGCASLGWGTTADSENLLSLQVDGHRFQVEIADTESERNRGLMYREKLGKNRGMLFVYPDEQPRSFWMKNTPLPLSIAFLSKNGEVLRIADLVPFSQATVSSIRPAMYALEVNRGRFSDLEIEKGSRVEGLPGPSQQ